MAKKLRKSNNISFYRHESDTRNNAVLEYLTSYNTAKPKPKKYDYDQHLEFLAVPFKINKQNCIAVKVIDHRGNELMML